MDKKFVGGSVISFSRQLRLAEYWRIVIINSKLLYKAAKSLIGLPSSWIGDTAPTDIESACKINKFSPASPGTVPTKGGERITFDRLQPRTIPYGSGPLDKPPRLIKAAIGKKVTESQTALESLAANFGHSACQPLLISRNRHLRGRRRTRTRRKDTILQLEKKRGKKIKKNSR